VVILFSRSISRVGEPQQHMRSLPIRLMGRKRTIEMNVLSLGQVQGQLSQCVYLS